MSARINRFLLEQTRHDSGELVQPDFVVHPFAEPGRYQVDVYRHGKAVTTMMLEVSGDCADQQLSIDLAALERPATKSDCSCHDGDHVQQVAKGGYVLFYVGSGSGGYSVKTYPAATKTEKGLFDSQALQGGDLFGTTLLRPGHYKIEDKAAKLSIPLKVEPVKPGKTAYVPPDALHFDIAELRKQKKGIQLQQAQGLVIRTDKDNRIVIVFDDKDECGENTPTKVARWSKGTARRRTG